MPQTTRTTAGLRGLALIAFTLAVAVLVWPLRANGVSGNAFVPHYSAFGFATTQTQFLPEHPTYADLRRAGVRVPQDVVAHRRHLSELIAGIGALALVGLLGLYLRNRPSKPPTR